MRLLHSCLVGVALLALACGGQSGADSQGSSRAGATSTPGTGTSFVDNGGEDERPSGGVASAVAGGRGTSTAGGGARVGGAAGGGHAAGGSALGGSATGSFSGGGTSGGETNAGGSANAGESASGGSSTGDPSTGGATGGGSASGGAPNGGSVTGGIASGGTAGGGTVSGGTAGGGTASGGTAGGGTASGGTAGGGTATGGTATGGSSSGGAATGGSASGGATCFVAAQADDCCSDPFPATAEELQDPCVLLHKPHYPPEELAGCPSAADCSIVDCVHSSPPSRSVRMEAGQCIWVDECVAAATPTSFCTVATDFGRCCSCPDVYPIDFVQDEPCILTEGAPEPGSCADCSAVSCAPCNAPAPAASCLPGDAARFDRCGVRE